MANAESRSASKTPSAYLMSIVRTLSSSAGIEQREQQKTRIVKAFRESDKRLTELVADNYEDVTKVLQSFGKMKNSITESRAKIRKIKDDLSSCKTLLHFKRDELRKLWRDGVEHKAVLSMLEQIEKIKEIPDKMDAFVEKKFYLHATDLIVQSVAKLEGPLAGIEALRDLRVELHNRKDMLHEKLIEEVNHQIYSRSVQAATSHMGRAGRLRRHDSWVRGWMADETLPETPSSSHTGAQVNRGRLEVTEDLNRDPTENLAHFVAILAESLYVLRKVSEAVEITKMRMEPELMTLVTKACDQVADRFGEQNDDFDRQLEPGRLLDLLQMIVQQCRRVAATHRIFLNSVWRLTPVNNSMHSDAVYDMTDVWSNIQAVLQVLLSEYLDVRNAVSARKQTSDKFDEWRLDVGQYFNKKKPTRSKIPLFRFDASLHALSTNSYIEDTRHLHSSCDQSEIGELSIMSIQRKVCKPSVFNITAVYKPIMIFIQEIEDMTNGPAGLREFISDFIQNVFLTHVQQKTRQGVDIATRVKEEDGHKCFDALRNVIEDNERRELGVSRPLLQSTVTVDARIEELRELMTALPDYADDFLTMVCNVLRDYREKCLIAYRNIVQHSSTETHVISAMWAKDEDISRFLRSLPSWHTLQQNENELEMGDGICSEQEMRSLNLKEAEILITNLSTNEAVIPQTAIIADTSQIRTVANVHESLEWFASRMRKMVNEFEGINSDAVSSDNFPPSVPKDPVSVSPSMIHWLCAMLQSNYAGPIDDLDPDSNVLKLNKDLSGMEEVLSQSLLPRKFRYIFETLGYLVASILISSVQFLKKINENGIKKMCRNILAIQQNLTNITMARESDLDRARQFYELLYLTPDDVVTGIAEKGCCYNVSDYSSLIHLYHRSHPGIPAATQEAQFRQLSEVIKKSSSLHE